MTQATVPNLASGIIFDNIVKSFGATYALRNVSLTIDRGEIVALLGENGAGKSTLIKVLGGIYKPNSGRVMVDGVDYSHKTGNISTPQTVAFIHQDLGLIEWMSIAENICLSTGYIRKNGLIDWDACEAITREVLARVGCDFHPSARVSTLSRAEKSLVAIARVLAVKCNFLVLDEPSASLPAADVKRLFKVLRQLKSEGVGVIYVSHRLDEIFQIADRAVVLRDGQMVGARDVASTTPEELVDLIVGRKSKCYTKSAPNESVEILKVKELILKAAGPISFDVRGGEIVGLVGLRGAGQENIGRCLFGEMEYEGEVYLQGNKLAVSSPKEAIAAGIGLIARDRVLESLSTFMSIRENFFINPSILGKVWHSFISPREENTNALSIGDGIGLTPNQPDLPIEALSGGNQQKVVVGRWLQADNRLLIAEDPTAGVDVGAKAEIYDLLNNNLSDNTAILVISTDFEEVAEICHRALVFSRGRVNTELSGVSLTTESLIQAASASDNIEE